MAFIGGEGGGGGGGWRPAWRGRARMWRPGQQPQTPIQPPGAPAPPTPPVGSQIPGQGIYLQKQAMAEQAYQQALAQLAQRKSETFRNFGFLENGQVDPNNKFGQLQNMWREQAGTADQEDYSLLGRGIRGGLAGQANTMRRLAEGGQNLDLQNRYSGAMQEIATARTGAENERNAALLAAQQEAMQEALQQERFTPAQVPTEPEPPGNPQLPGRKQARRHVARARARQHKGRRR